MQKIINDKTKRLSFKMQEEEYYSLREEYSGICLACGEVRWGDTEPDARNYPCEECGENKAFGIEELVIMGKVEILEQ